MAYEAGYREQVTVEFAVDLAVFFHDYNDSITRPIGTTLVMGAPEGVFLPVNIDYAGQSQAYGAELSSSWQVSPCWRVMGAYSFLRVVGAEVEDPHHRVYFQSSWDVTETLQVDAMLRYVDRRSGFSTVPKYVTADLRLGWEPCEGLEMFVSGRNLLDNKHFEWVDSVVFEQSATHVEREVFAGINLRF